MPLWSIGRALAHRNFRLFLAGQGISLIGTWMQQIALPFLVYRLTNSAFLLGLVGFSGQIPALFIAPLAGVFTDRWNRHRALLVTQTLAMLQSVALLSLMLLHDRGMWNIEIWQLIVLGMSLGFVNGFDMPLRQTFLTEMVADRDHLANAIALNSSIVNGARLIGPSVAGLLIAAWGEWTCFLFNTLSYLAVLVALLLMRDLPVRPVKQNGLIMHGLKEGVRYAYRFRPIRAILLLLALMSLMAMSLAVLLPVFASDEILGGKARTQGFLTACSGAGALVGALYLASRRGVLGLGSRMALACVSCGLGMIAFSFSRVLWLSYGLIFVTGLSTMVLLASSNTLLQTIVEEDKRGRVMSFYTMAFIGMAPIGSLLAGTVADRFGAPFAVRVGGFACILGGALFAIRLPALREQVRPIYERAGILVPRGEQPVD